MDRKRTRRWEQNRTRLLAAFALIVSTLLPACSTYKNIVVPPHANPEEWKTAVLLETAGNSHEMDENLRIAMYRYGVDLLPRDTVPGSSDPSGADILVKYTDVWAWDLAMYLRELDIIIYDPKTYAELARGEWDNSAFHGFHDAREVTLELVDAMFAELNGGSRGQENP